jgi:hypothetical protein
MLCAKREWIILGCYFMIYQFAGTLKPSQLYVSAPSNRNLDTWKALGAHTSNKNGLQGLYEQSTSVCFKDKL